MDLVWSEFEANLRRMLKDVESSKWDDDFLTMAANWALDDFAFHVPKELKPETTAFGDISDRTVDLPTGTVQVLAVRYGDGQYLEPLEVLPGFKVLGIVGYYHYPAFNQIVLTTDPTLDITVYAGSIYGAFDGVDATKIEDLPLWAEAALMYCTCSFALDREAVSSADLRRWNTKADSGTPIHNPLRDQANAFRALYDQVLNRHRAQTIKSWMPGRR